MRSFSIRSMRKRRNDFESAPEITLTPLIDTALVLLVIFMVATPIMYNSLKVDLPKGNMKEAKSNNQQITIEVDSSNKIYVAGELTNKNNLVNVVEKKVAGRRDAVVSVNGDAAASFEAVVQVVDQIKYAAGVENVILGLKA